MKKQRWIPRHLTAALALLLIAAVLGLAPASVIHAVEHEAEHGAEHAGEHAPPDCSVCVLAKHLSIQDVPTPASVEFVEQRFPTVRPGDRPVGAPTARPVSRGPPIAIS